MIQSGYLPLERCPHCKVAKPTLEQKWNQISTDSNEQNRRAWSVYKCKSCGSFLLVCSPQALERPISEIWPRQENLPDVLPDRAKHYLSQAIESRHAPSGAIMLTASAVDAMMKDKGYKKGSLNDRIDQAEKDHLITSEMAAWAHEIRLDANDQRHADEASPLPTMEEADKVIEFAKALTEFLYVLPARVARGRKP